MVRKSRSCYRRENNATFLSSNHHHKYSVYMIHAHTVWKITSLIRSWEPAKICHQLHTAVHYCMSCRDEERKRETDLWISVMEWFSTGHSIDNKQARSVRHLTLPLSKGHLVSVHYWYKDGEFMFDLQNTLFSQLHEQPYAHSHCMGSIR